MNLLAAINWHSLFFLLYALVAIGFAIAVVTTSNIVRMAFYLTLCLGATAGLFFLAGAEFVGSMQLLIYVGGTLVLLIFGVMLTAQARFISMKTSGAEWVLAAILGGSLLLLLLQADYSVASWNQNTTDPAAISIFDSKSSTPIGLALTGVRVDKLDESNEQLRRGMSGYLFPFVIISMHLLVVLIGAGYMARTKRVGRTVFETAAPVVRPARRHRLSVLGGIFTGIGANSILAVLCIAYWLRPPGTWAWIARQLEPAANWLWPVLGALFLANVLMLVVVYGWQKWGVIGLALATVAQALAIGNAGLPATWAWIFLIVALLPVVGLIVTLNSRPRPSEWELME